MRIGIEAQRIFRSNKHGMDYVVLQEILHLQQMDKENEYFVFVKPGPDRCVQSTENVHVIELGMPSYPLWEQIALPRAARKAKVDILHCTSNTAPINCKIPLVLTLHDIIFLEPRDKANKSVYQNLGWVYRRWNVPRIMSNCRRIITVSNFELQNIICKTGVEKNRMAMIYNGYNDIFQQLSDVNQVYRKYINEPGYLLFLGNTDPKKNTERTLIAYSLYLEQSKVKRKLLVGDINQPYLEDIINRNRIDNIRDGLVQSGYIPNKDLVYLYNNAFAFLYTSLRESFGIPLLEGMACGVPVITSNTSSMPEIGGNNAILVNPESPQEIAGQLLKLEQDADYYEEKRQVGLERAKLFSWKHTAEQLLQLYKDVYKEIG